MKIIVVLIFANLVCFASAQTRLDISKATSVHTSTDSVNGVKEYIFSFYKPGKKWQRTDVSRIYSKDSTLLGECIRIFEGEGCITAVTLEEITMYDENRDYRTREKLRSERFLVKRYDKSGKLLSTARVHRLDLKDEWDLQVYRGTHVKERPRSGRVK
jgi:hypothetical protein